MSVDSRIIVGHTINIAYDLEHEDFRKVDSFISKHPELDEDRYRYDDKEKRARRHLYRP